MLNVALSKTNLPIPPKNITAEDTKRKFKSKSATTRLGK